MPGASARHRPARRARTLAALTALLALLVSTGAVATPAGAPGLDGAAPAAPAAEVIPDSYIVLLDSEHPSAVAQEHARRHGVSVDRVYRAALQGYAATIPERALHAIERDPRVLAVEPNIRMEAFSTEEPIIPTGIDRSAFTPYLADVNDGYRNYGDAPAVAVLDTGIERGRAELNVIGRVDCMDVYEVTIGNPRNRGTFGECVTARDGEPVANDEDGHGTHVAGTIGASGSILGVAPGVPLYAVQVLGPDGGTMAGVAAGVDWVVAENAKADVEIGVINMSLGGSGSYETMDTAIANAAAAGIVTVVAAGNSDADASGFTPANSPEAITVGALSDLDGKPGGLVEYEGPCWSAGCPEDDARAPFSNYGSTVDIAAPGVFIESTVPGGYAEYSGTSMAAPHVAGAAILALHDDENVAPTDVRDHLVEEWTVAPGDDAGYTPTTDKPIGPLLYLGGQPVAEPSLSLADLGASPATAEPGDTVTVTGYVVNAGGAAAESVTVTLSLADQALEVSEPFTVSADSSVDFTLDWQSPAEHGEYVLDVTVEHADEEVARDHVTVTVGEDIGDEDPPETDDGLAVEADAYKVRGVKHVDLTVRWEGGHEVTSTDLVVSRDDEVELNELRWVGDAEGPWAATDSWGARGGGSHTYEVCVDIDASVPCAIVIVDF